MNQTIIMRDVTEFFKIYTMKDRYRGFKMYLTAVSEQAKKQR